MIEPSESYIESLCVNNDSPNKQILVREVKTLRPYDGFKVYLQNEDLELVQLGDVQWIAPLSILFPSKIEELVNIDCGSNDLHPIFTTNIISKTNEQLNLTLATARVIEQNADRYAEAKINASILSEITGKFIRNKSKTVKLKLKSGISQADLIKTLQKAIRTATLEALTEIRTN